VIRRSLTPPIGIPLPGLHATRRAGGARRNVSYRVQLFRPAEAAGASTDGAAVEITGWALNISRGGLRAVVEDPVVLGETLEIHVEEESLVRRGLVVWTQEEPDGMIVGIAFEERLEAAPPGIELDSSVEIAPGELAKTLQLAEADLKELLGTPGKDGPGTPEGGAGSSGGGRA